MTRDGIWRWMIFNSVGLIGVAVQLAALAFFDQLLRLNYLAGTVLAVETAVLHNFIWHERWTWRDRAEAGDSTLPRLLRFNFTTGLVSILTNLVLMRWLVETLHTQYLIANLISIAAGSAANFFLSDLLVFRDPDPRPMM